MTTTGIAASLATHLREPMRRSAYALIAGTGLTSLLGIVFWLLAARLLPAEAVGTGTALISAMTFLATLSTLGLRNSLVRFLAPAGASARRLIVSCYLLCTSAAILSAVVFVIGQPFWASKLDFLHQNRLIALAFVIATAVWVLFVLEDHVLIGLRRSGWVPVNNGIYSGVKIALLPAVVSGGAYALLAAYALPAAPIVVVVTVFVLWLAGHRTEAPEPAEKLRIAPLIGFAAADHSSTLLWLATTELLTLVVLQEAGAAASAYYFMSFTIAYSLYLITSNVGSALVAEAARYPQRAASLARDALRHATLLVLPLAVVGVFLTPFGLGLLGQDYATNGTVLLRLLLVSAVPQAVIGIALGAARVRRDNRMILVVYAAQAIGVFGGTVLTIDRWGLTGVGLAWLVTQTTVALVLLLTKRHGSASRRPRPRASDGHSGLVRLRVTAAAQPPAGTAVGAFRAERTGFGVPRHRLSTADLRERLAHRVPPGRGGAGRPQDRHHRSSLAWIESACGDGLAAQWRSRPVQGAESGAADAAAWHAARLHRLAREQVARNDRRQPPGGI